jgi:hypothetical protein
MSCTQHYAGCLLVGECHPRMTTLCSAFQLPGDAAGAGEADGGNSLLGSISIGVVGEHGGDGAELQESNTVSMKHEGKKKMM